MKVLIKKQNNQPIINLSNISKSEKLIIGKRFLNAVDKFFDNPENESKYQKWLKNTNQNVKRGNNE